LNEKRNPHPLKSNKNNNINKQDSISLV